MRSRFLPGGMAAAPVDGRTRFAFLGVVRGPGVLLAVPLLVLLGGPAGRLVLRRFAARVRQREAPPPVV